MKLTEAKQQFIHSWGVLGSQWGINRTMAQVHSLLLVASKPLSTDEVMEELSISRGNANMNLRDLMGPYRQSNYSRRPERILFG